MNTDPNLVYDSANLFVNCYGFANMSGGYGNGVTNITSEDPNGFVQIGGYNTPFPVGYVGISAPGSGAGIDIDAGSTQAFLLGSRITINAGSGINLVLDDTFGIAIANPMQMILTISGDSGPMGSVLTANGDGTCNWDPSFISRLEAVEKRLGIKSPERFEKEKISVPSPERPRDINNARIARLNHSQ